MCLGTSDLVGVGHAQPETGIHTKGQRSPASELQALYRSLYVRARGYARKLVGESDADDIVQEAFMRLVKYKSGTKVEISEHFMLGTVRNVAYSHLSRRIKDKQKLSDVGPRSETADEHEGYGDYASAGRMLADLSEGQREALVLVTVMGLSETQASLAMRTSRPVVNAKRCRAVERLRESARDLHIAVNKEDAATAM
jgi:RNA polymerase sigma factor (sigma-70 family)